MSDFLNGDRRVQLSASPGEESPLVILDSSFNPPTWAHVILARHGIDMFPHGTIVLMLATGNADKPAASPQNLQFRLDMMKRVADTELHQWPVVLGLTSQPQFLAKAEALKLAFPSNRLIFAMGFDTLLRLLQPQYYDVPVDSVLSKLFAISEILVLTREPDEVSRTPQSMKSASSQRAIIESELGAYLSKVHMVEASEDTNEVSSSRARTSEKAIRRLTPPAVADYAIEKSLYSFMH